MPRVLLPRDCAGFSDGDHKFMGERGPGSFVHIDESSPAGAEALRKLAAQDLACAGLTDAGPEKYFTRRGVDGRRCGACRRTWFRWSVVCPRCGRDTVPEAQVPRRPLSGPYVP
jgi:hypothetical protein